MSKFEHIRYDTLNPRQKEVFHFQKVAATLADYGFNWRVPQVALFYLGVRLTAAGFPVVCTWPEPSLL
jgi:hypothetical protein